MLDKGTEERSWIDAAIEISEEATRRGVTILLVRRQDGNNEADVAVTNATSTGLLHGLAFAMNGPAGARDDDE